MDRQPLGIWTDNHLEYGRETTWDKDRQPLGIWTDSQSENKQTTIPHMDEQPHRK